MRFAPVYYAHNPASCERMIRKNSFLLRASLLGALCAAALAAPMALSAQEVTSRPVVQPLPPQDTQRLNRALVELAKQPQSVPRLLEAGNAALAVNDLDGAMGFFKRLTEIEPENEAATLGLARVYMRSGRPIMALLYFDAAQSRGASPIAIGSDQALTLDMLGDQARAQAGYVRLIEASPKDDEARRRLAISFAISGKRAPFEATLRPLTDRRDFAAFRARTFGLAILGELDRAKAIADAVMPRTLAQRISPYLDFMPRLTAAQQAAAANLGIFPKAADIGRDSPAVLAYMRDRVRPVPSRAAATPAVSAQDRLEPAGVPLGEETTASESADPESATAAIPAPAPAKAAAAERTAATVADAFDDIEPALPVVDASAQDADAVNIAAIDAPREAPPAPELPANPSRIWVQVATGQDLEALGFDWRRLRRKASDELEGFTPHTVPWGQANRLLAGPLESREDARDLINALSRKGIDSFRYTSPEGVEIQELTLP